MTDVLPPLSQLYAEAIEKAIAAGREDLVQKLVETFCDLLERPEPLKDQRTGRAGGSGGAARP
jgi:hypothetical protein